MVNFLTIMLVNLVVGLVLLALYFYKYVDGDAKKLASGFLVVGFLLTLTGLYVMMLWPLPGTYNIAFGEPALYFGVLLFVAGLSFIFNWDLTGLSIAAFFAGVIAVVVGLRLISLEMTKEPMVSGVAFILTGTVGILTLPAYIMKEKTVIRYALIVVALIAAGMWAVTGFGAYWGHLAG